MIKNKGVNGVCVAQGSTFVCECPPGYSGQRCEFKDPCFDKPCKNGHCLSTGNGFVIISLIKLVLILISKLLT